MSKMYGLKKSVNGNEGTAVVEATFIIPVVVFIVVAVIFLFLDVINDAVIQGNVYYELYTISKYRETTICASNPEKLDKIIEELNDKGYVLNE